MNEPIVMAVDDISDLYVVNDESHWPEHILPGNCQFIHVTERINDLLGNDFNNGFQQITASGLSNQNNWRAKCDFAYPLGCSGGSVNFFRLPTEIIEYYLNQDTNQKFLVLLDLKHNDFRCSPLNTSPNTQCFIKTYIVNGKIYAPAQNCKKYRCGYCSYQLNLKSKQFSKNFTGFFFSPIEIKTFTLYAC